MLVTALLQELRTPQRTHEHLNELSDLLRWNSEFINQCMFEERTVWQVFASVVLINF